MSQLSESDKMLLEKFHQLSSQQRQNINDFLDFLLSQNPWVSTEEEENQVSFYEANKELAGAIDGLPSDLSTNKKYLRPPDKKQLSFYEATKEMAGALDFGPGDLSTNKKYLEGIGK